MNYHDFLILCESVIDLCEIIITLCSYHSFYGDVYVFAGVLLIFYKPSFLTPSYSPFCSACNLSATTHLDKVITLQNHHVLTDFTTGVSNVKYFNNINDFI